MLSSMQLIKYWLPGVAGTQPRLGPVLGGRLTKGGLHQPPFYFSLTSLVSRINLSAITIRDCYHGPGRASQSARVSTSGVKQGVY